MECCQIWECGHFDNTLKSCCERWSDVKLCTLYQRLTTQKEPVAKLQCSDGLVAAVIELQMAVSEFLSDWKKGDFTLNKYAALDAQVMEEKLIKLCKLQDGEGN